jgi:hypothetical protein
MYILYVDHFEIVKQCTYFTWIKLKFILFYSRITVEIWTLREVNLMIDSV